MALTFQQIIGTVTLEQGRQFMIDVLRSLGFSGAGSWQPGSFGRTLGVEAPARLYVDFRTIVTAYGKGGYNDEAQGDYLTLYSKSSYDNDRVQATKTRGVVELTSAATSPPHTVAAGDLVVADVIKGRTFRNLFEVTIAPGATEVVQVEAEVAGNDGNVPINTIQVLVTTLVGVEVDNPGISGEWITQVGADQEKDEELRTRNRTKWATRAYATPRDAYVNYALEANAAITRVWVDDRNPPIVLIYIAGPSGGLGSGPDQDVVDYIEGDVDGFCRRPIGAIVQCESAVNRTIAVEGTVFIASAYAGQAQADVEVALEKFFETIPIGGTKTTGDGAVFFSALYMTVMRVTGVMNVVFTAPTGDVVLDPEEVPVPDIDLTFTII